MATLTFAVKAKMALLLPGLLIAYHVNHVADARIEFAFDDVESIGSEFVILRLGSDEGSRVIRGGNASIHHIIDAYLSNKECRGPVRFSNDSPTFNRSQLIYYVGYGVAST